MNRIGFWTKGMVLGIIVLLIGVGSVPTIFADSMKTDKNSSPMTVSSDLVAYWNFNEGSGIILHDSSGYGNNGTIYGNPIWTSGFSGNAIYFDGENDWIDCGNDASLNPTTGITLAAWYKPVSFYGTGNDPIIDKGFGQHEEPYYQYHLGVVGNYYATQQARFTFYVANSDYDDVRTGNNFWIPNVWYHVVGTYDGITMKLYINGRLDDTNNVMSSMTNFGENVLIARYSDRDDYLPGTIDEVRIYNRALTEKEIQDLYNILEFNIEGGRGINVNITNIGPTNATNIDWQIDVKGGVLGGIHMTVGGTIGGIAQGESIQVGTGTIFGLGKIQITITVDEETLIVNGTQLFIFTKIKT